MPAANPPAASLESLLQHPCDTESGNTLLLAGKAEHDDAVTCTNKVRYSSDLTGNGKTPGDDSLPQKMVQEKDEANTGYWRILRRRESHIQSMAKGRL